MARKFKSYRKYDYKEGSGKKKKIILIVLAVVLVLAIAIAAALLLLGGSETPTETTFTIQSLPEKTAYYVGDVPDWSGLEVALTTPEGNTVILKPNNCAFSGFNSSAPTQNQVITVQYKEYTTTFTISILDPADKPVDKQFTGKMSFKTLPKTNYKVGESLSIEGGVLLMEYADGSKEEMALTEYMLDGFLIDGNLVSSFVTTKAGKFTVQVSYLEDVKWAYAYYEITVTN